MIRDTIVEEVRAIRDEIAKAHDYNVDAIFESLRAAEESSGTDHVTLEPRRTAEYRSGRIARTS